VLITTREKKPRAFADPRRALLLLRDLGVREAKVDTKLWRPEEADLLRPVRPDRAEAMRQLFDSQPQD
jgi:hypothetical protein